MGKDSLHQRNGPVFCAIAAPRVPSKARPGDKLLSGKDDVLFAVEDRAIQHLSLITMKMVILNNVVTYLSKRKRVF